MLVMFAGHSYPFQPWKPELGRVITKAYSFDCETTLLDEARPWITPAYVIGAAFDGVRGYFVTRKYAADFFRAHKDLPVAMHHAAFDLGVLNVLAPGLKIYDWVEVNRVWDTQLLHRLYMLGTEGHTAGGKGGSTLENCVQRYLNTELPKDTKDSKENIVRLSYGQWLNQPPQAMEPVYLQYLAQDAIATHLVCDKLLALLKALQANSQDVWGFVSPEWLQEQTNRWGPQTHHIQLKASIVLERITVNGLHLDVKRRDKLIRGLRKVLKEFRRKLAKHGYLPGKGSDKALQGILWRLERQHPEMNFPRTATGKVSTTHDSLVELANTVPFVKLLMEYRETDKLLGSFLNKMTGTVLHPSFGVLARSGRTSSFGQINAQNLPKDPRVRSCFVPSPGSIFLDVDYKQIELATLAQSCIAQFKLNSKMAAAINSGRDLHTLVAAHVTGKAEKDVTKDERQKAKPINFGKPGGMSNATLKLYAKVECHVTLDDNQVEALSNAWFTLFPEMHDFLKNDDNLGLEIATLLDLTPASHEEHTGNGRFTNHPANAGREHLPHAILGSMSVKVFKCEQPCTQVGVPYPAFDIDYFWTRLVAKLDLLPKRLHSAIQARLPSPQLQRAVMGLVGRAGVFTLTGRLRANAAYCARHNTVFQGLAADGMKLALWKLWRAAYRIVNEIHDQVLVEVPADSDRKAHAERIKSLMIEGMTAVVPDVLVDVSYAATNRWHKDAKDVFNGDGTVLKLWRPPSKTKPRKAEPLVAAAC